MSLPVFQLPGCRVHASDVTRKEDYKGKGFVLPYNDEKGVRHYGSPFLLENNSRGIMCPSATYLCRVISVDLNHESGFKNKFCRAHNLLSASF